MAQRRSIWLGVGCLVLVVGFMVGILALRMLMAPRVPQRSVLSLTFDAPIVELKADDPFAELFGEGVISLRDVRTALRRAAEDDRIVGVRVRFDSFGGGLAAAQEIRALLEDVRRAGKWSYAYMDTAGEFAPGNLVYLVASACDRIYMNPMGDVNIIGFSVRSPFIAGTFEKLGIEAEFPGRGDYKTARFMYTQRDFTPEHREMMEWLLDSFMTQFVNGIGASRELEPSVVRALVDRAPLMGEEAVETGLVDELTDWTGFLERVEEAAGDDVSMVGLGRYLSASARPMTGPKIAVVTGVGSIMLGRSHREFGPIVSGEVMGSETMAQAWRDVREASGIKAAVFRVDSPGGSAIASEVIRSEMARTAEQIPVVVSMAEVAASGGYWISCGAQRIIADPGTVTASIGVFAGHLDTSGLMTDKLGITYGRLDRGEHADLYGSLSRWDDGDRATIERMLDRIYVSFLQRVSAARNMPIEAVDEIARGRVFTGEQAIEIGLIDALGGFDQAVAHAKELAGIAPESAVQLVDFPKQRPFWQQLLERQSDDQMAVKAGLQTLNELLQGGTIRTPGVVWMPPLVIE